MRLSSQHHVPLAQDRDFTKFTQTRATQLQLNRNRNASSRNYSRISLNIAGQASAQLAF